MDQGRRVLYSVEQAATLLSISRAQLYRLLDRGELESVQIGRSRRISVGQIERFVANLEARSNPHPLHRKPNSRGGGSFQ
jgi:excisionase family DNA binding protein